MTFRLGDKLDVPDIKDRIKLLVDGQTFFSKDGRIIVMNDFRLTYGEYHFSEVRKCILLQDWYYPALTYTINGVELTDNRVTQISKNYKEYYVSDCLDKNYFSYANSTYANSNGNTSKSLERLIKRSLLHNTKEAAVLHAKAIMRVSGSYSFD